MHQWFVRFSEFAEFSEFLFHLGKTPMFQLSLQPVLVYVFKWISDQY